MKFGLALPIMWRWADYRALRNIAQAAEALGFDSLWTGDHVVAPVGPLEQTAVVQSQGGWMKDEYQPPARIRAADFFAGENWWPEVYTLLGYLAGVTSTIQLGASVIVLPYRNPIVQARMVATLDNLSNGRLLYGVGAGHIEGESAVLGVPYAERGAMTDEYIELMKAMWASDCASFEGRYFQFKDLLTLGQPLQRPHPPLYAGGMAKAAIRRAVKYCQGWLAHGYPPHELARGIDYARQYAAEIGRTEPLDVIPSVTMFETRLEEAEVAATYSGSVYAKSSNMTTDELTARIRSYQPLGVNHVWLGLYPPNEEAFLRQMRRVAEKVMPAFRPTG